MIHQIKRLLETAPVSVALCILFLLAVLAGTCWLATLPGAWR